MNDTPRTRVVLVDDDDLVLMGLRLVLGADTSIEVVAEAGDGRAALDAVRRTAPDVVLLDIRMPTMDGLTALRTMRSWPQGCPAVIMLTTYDTDEMVLTALQEGAAGFLLKNIAPQALVDAVRTVADGRPMLSPTVTAQLIAAVGRRPARAVVAEARSRLAGLTDREREVARAVARGLSNAEIAAELFLGVGTVKTHVGHILEKLGADNRVQVALVVRDADD